MKNVVTNNNSGRILGIDYGSKRVGIAISDENQQFALPVLVIKSSKNLLKDIIKIAKENTTSEIVMGESRNYKGQPNEIFSDANILKKELEDSGFKVYFELEFMTSVQAERFQGKSDMTDASAAALILQSYLDKNKKS
jgi:putative Holliday junction resolvase